MIWALETTVIYSGLVFEQRPLPMIDIVCLLCERHLANVGSNNAVASFLTSGFPVDGLIV